MKTFSDISFGEISAEAEREHNPKLIKDGFVDLNKIEDEALNGKRFLFLGYKGSGKSSIGERIDLTQGGKYNRFVRKVSLADFPFTPFSKIIKGDMEPEAKFPTAWSWILLIYAIESFSKDTATTHPELSDFSVAIQAFKDLGISPDASPASIARTSSKNSFTAKLPYNLFEAKSETGQTKSLDDIFNFVSSLKAFIVDTRSPNRHYIIIDGLDDILSSRSIQYKSLYALIQESSELNNLLSKNNVPLKFIVLCRTDLFDKTPGPNKNKIRNPFAFELDWYHDPNEPETSMLVRGANLRAKNSLGRDVDIFSEFLPNYTHDTPTRQYFLDMTRHTPRDFFQLLSSMQRYHTGGRMTETQVKSGLRDYSIKYFQPEIHDELSGYAEVDDINSFFAAASVVGKRDFTYVELNSAWEKERGSGRETTLISLCKAMFDCSAIGHTSHTNGKTHYSFKYRNRLSAFSQVSGIMMHRGLWKAMNIS